MLGLFKWIAVGATLGAMAVLAAAVYAILDETYLRCAAERCHDLGYVLAHAPGYLVVIGPIGAAIGGVAGLALGVAVSAARRTR